MKLKQLYLCLFALLWGMSTVTAAWTSLVGAESAALVLEASSAAEENERPVLEPLQLIQPGSGLQLNLRTDAAILTVLWPEVADEPIHQIAALSLPADNIIGQQEIRMTCIQPAQAP